MVHLGTLVAVCAVFYKDIWFMITHPTSKQTIFLIVATIPAVVVTLFFSDFIESAFGGSYLGFGFLLTAVFLLVAWKFGAQRGGRRFRDMGVKDSLVMGLMQARRHFAGHFPERFHPYRRRAVRAGSERSPCDLDF